MHPAEELTQKEAARRLALTPRQLRNLADHGVPRLESGLYPWPDTQKWYVEFKKEEERRRSGRSDDTEYEKSRARKMAAQAEREELEVAQLRGELVTLEVVEQEWARSLSRARGVLLALPGKIAPDLIGLRSIPEVIAVLEPAVAAAMEALSGAGADDDEDDEQEAEAA